MLSDLADVFHASQAATNRERHEALRGGAFDNIDHSTAFVAGGGDVEKNKFIGTLLLVGLGLLDGVARINQVDEVHTFDHTSFMDV